jgi:hypothetical protein
LTEIHLHHAGSGQETLSVQTARQGPGKSEVIIRQGDLQADYFYVIAQGKVGARPYRCAAAAPTPRPPAAARGGVRHEHVLSRLSPGAADLSVS